LSSLPTQIPGYAYARYTVSGKWNETHGVVAETAYCCRVAITSRHITSMNHVTVVSKHWPWTVTGMIGLWADSVQMIDSC